MKFYLASSFALVDRVQAACDALEAAGHTITVKWWNRKYYLPGEGNVRTTDLKNRFNHLDDEAFYSRPETKKSYLADYQGVKDADVFIIIAGDKRRAFNGANIELGIALGDNKPCFSLGVLDTSVLYYDVIKRATIEEIIGEVDE